MLEWAEKEKVEILDSQAVQVGASSTGLAEGVAADAKLLCVGGAPCLDERVEYACRGPPGREGVSPQRM